MKMINLKIAGLALGYILMASACSKAGVQVILDTQAGPITIEVYEDKAPITAADFLYYVDNGLYDGQGFYRAVSPQNDPRDQGMSLIQGGRLDVSRLTAEIELESTAQTGLIHKEGSVSVAREADDHSGNAAYFFISLAENDMLNHGGDRLQDGLGFAVFGQVVDGLDIVRAIQTQSVQDGMTHSALPEGQYLKQPVIIHSARRK